jgi:pimeloyl-ACP methyl ester carboxylesterase
LRRRLGLARTRRGVLQASGWAGRDTAADPATWLGKALPRGESDEIHVVPGGHFMHQQLAGQFNALALSWLDKWLP